MQALNKENDLAPFILSSSLFNSLITSGKSEFLSLEKF